MEAFSIEELARTTDDLAVRRRFNHRNRFWLTLLLFFFTFVSIPLTFASVDSTGIARQPILGITSAVLDILLLLLMLDARRLGRPARQFLFLAPARLVRDHPTAVLIGWAIVQHMILVTYVYD